MGISSLFNDKLRPLSDLTDAEVAAIRDVWEEEYSCVVDITKWDYANDGIDCWALDTTTLQEPNIPLLRKIYEHVVANPTEWTQSVWSIDLTVELNRNHRELEHYQKMVERALKEGDSNTVAYYRDVAVKTETRIKELTENVNLCSTAACICGHAIMMEGKHFTYNESGLSEGVYDQDNNLVKLPISYQGQMALGLTAEEAAALFDGRNGLAAVQLALIDIFERGGEVFQP